MRSPTARALLDVWLKRAKEERKEGGLRWGLEWVWEGACDGARERCSGSLTWRTILLKIHFLGGTVVAVAATAARLQAD